VSSIDQTAELLRNAGKRASNYQRQPRQQLPTTAPTAQQRRYGQAEGKIRPE
jgi:hypothetical protein